MLLLLVLSFIFGRDFLGLFSGAPQSGQANRSAPVQETPGEHKQVQFVSFVLDDVQKTWSSLIPNYTHAKLVLFRDAVQSGCGVAGSSTGPFYCPTDGRVYLDLGFFDELRDRFGAPGEFAQAYVIAHEVGHHVQDLLGLTARPGWSRGGSAEPRNQASVRVELQADCFAGIWANSTAQREIIDQADIAAGLQAAAAIGDDRLQRMSRGYVTPETFTHGSSAERVQWFRTGLRSGDVAACDIGR